MSEEEKMTEGTNGSTAEDGPNDEKNEDSAEQQQQRQQLLGPALVLGASTDQGHAVITGLIESSKFSTVYGGTRDVTTSGAIEASNLGAVLMELDLASPESVEKVLFETKAEYVFLVTTTDLPSPDGSGTKTCKEAEDKEYDSIITFFDMLVAVHFKDNIDRHVVFSTLDNVKRIVEETSLEGQSDFIKPLDDGSIVANFSGKGRAGEYALKKMENVPGVSLTLLTLPLLHSNFMGWATPLPNEAKTQWTISAALGDHAVDMFSVDDLATIVPTLFEDKSLYKGYNLRVSAEKMTMETVAATFSDIFGKDVIYNPLKPEEMANIELPNAPLFAQMCQFLADDRSGHDVDVTEAVMFPRKPQRFRDWLLTHSDNEAFSKVGLDADASPIVNVAVFGATSLEGTAVVKGLLDDTRQKYQIVATSRDIEQDKAKAVKELDPDRVTLVQCNFDDLRSCAAALFGCEGVFLVTDFYEACEEELDAATVERHAKNVIDACAGSSTVKHLVFSTHESVDEMNKKLKLGLLPAIEAADGEGEAGDERSMSILPTLDAKARAASYARTKNLSCTYVLMPYYAEKLMELLAPDLETNDEGEEELVLDMPDTELKMVTMSVDELGPAVANIFDSYQVFAGREIGLVTDYVTIEEAVDVIVETMYSEKDSMGNTKTKKVRKKETKVEKWIEKRGTVTKDLGQMFNYYSKSDAVKKRRTVAQTLQLVPDARPMRKWLEDNRENVAFRQKMGIR